MRTMLVGECLRENIFTLWDPDASSETEFESVVVRGLACAYPSYECMIFTGGFRYDDRIYKPDLALVARDFSHWFIVEVELTTHSLNGHVLPQIRAFRYGEPQSDCASILARELRVAPSQIKTLLEFVPREVVVIANRWNQDWATALGALQTQFVTMSVFRAPNGTEAIELNGTLEAVSEHLGFGKYSATDRALVFPRDVRVADGEVQINDPQGSLATWMVTRAPSAAWFTKLVGTPDLPSQSQIQLVRTVTGGLSLRRAAGRSRTQDWSW